MKLTLAQPEHQAGYEAWQSHSDEPDRAFLNKLLALESFLAPIHDQSHSLHMVSLQLMNLPGVGTTGMACAAESQPWGLSASQAKQVTMLRACHRFQGEGLQSPSLSAISRAAE